MITTQTLFGIQCDQCKVHFGDEDDLGPSVFHTKEEAVEIAKSCDWRVEENGSSLCIDCQNIQE